jgi:hypothetical protein
MIIGLSLMHRVVEWMGGWMDGWMSGWKNEIEI